MLRLFALLLLVGIQVQAQPPASDWKSATTLPGVEMKGLTPTQQKTVLTVLRDFTCPCGCPMQLAQCRVEDPACGQSRALANMAVEAAAAGQSAAQLRKVLSDSPAVKSAAQRDRILLDPVPLNVAGSPVKGAANARVTLVEFSDFQCPYCVKAVGHLDAVLKAYPNDVRLVYKQFPLDSHSQAALAARASLAAHAQGKFWPLHDQMYANSRAINRQTVLVWAKAIGLDMDKFIAAFDSAETKAAVDKDLLEGGKAGVEATPTVYINGQKYQGSLEPAKLLPIIVEELKKR